MKNFVKKIFPLLPAYCQRKLTAFYEREYAIFSLIAMYFDGVDISIASRQINNKPRILFYHPSGLSFGGTEKFLQILAKHIDKKEYDVFFLYSSKPRKITGPELRLDGRKDYLYGQNIKMIEFNYTSMEDRYPYIIHDAIPSIFEVINNEKIDLIITAGSGYTEFPLNLIRRIPIIMLNSFGSFNVQRNFVFNCCVSEEVAKKLRPVVVDNKIRVTHVPSEGPTQESLEAGLRLRREMGINQTDMVFGRIGRPSDDIFDSIGIKAFQRLVAKNKNVHYVIMSPMPILKNIVSTENIPNVHFLPPSSKEEDVWAFHQSIDCLAHFRADGESFGLNIAEAMLCAKPIITHRSPVWNAHLEYLRPEFSRVADIGDVEAYYGFMNEFFKMKKEGKLHELGCAAKNQADKLFLIKNTIGKFEILIQQALR